MAREKIENCHTVWYVWQQVFFPLSSLVMWGILIVDWSATTD